MTVEGFAGLLQKHVAAGATEKAVDAAVRVQRGAKTMGRLIESLLELSRVWSREYSPEELDMAEVLHEVTESLLGPIEAAGATVEVVQPLPELFADRGQITSVLINLISNALAYGCPSPGHAIEVGGEEDRHEVRYYVRDHGPGIPKQHQERIFQLFQRASTDEEGTGLGLATVVKVVERHRGRTWVESEPGDGATFWFSVPRTRKRPHFFTTDPPQQREAG